MSRLLTVITLILTAALAFAQPQPREYHPSRPIYRDAKYVSLDCGYVADPQPLNSPNPVTLNGPAVVDFIIGHDGVVYSPFLRQSSGSDVQDRALLHLVKSWRYRPSSCNYTPTDSEAIVVFVP